MGSMEKVANSQLISQMSRMGLGRGKDARKVHFDVQLRYAGVGNCRNWGVELELE